MIDVSQEGSVSEHGEHQSRPYAKPLGDGAAYPSSPARPEPEGKAPPLLPRHAARHCATTTQPCPDEAVREQRVQPDVTLLGQIMVRNHWIPAFEGGPVWFRTVAGASRRPSSVNASTPSRLRGPIPDDS